MTAWIESIKGKYTLQLATTGRKTGLKRSTTIWFGVLDGNLYVSSGRGERSDWAKNIAKNGRVEVTIAGATKQGIAKIIRDPQIKQRLRKLYWRKYHIIMAFAELGKLLVGIRPNESIPILIEL
jgi:deazaflavin-dependent oxidoreductase (nitroreductase family)